MATKVVEFLREHGPLPAADLPHPPNVRDRRHGIWKFTASTRGRGETVASGQISAIYHLEGEHDRERVVRAFYVANPTLFETRDANTLVNLLTANGRQWKDAARAVVAEVKDGDE